MKRKIVKTKAAKIPKTRNKAAEKCAGQEIYRKSRNKAALSIWSATVGQKARRNFVTWGTFSAKSAPVGALFLLSLFSLYPPLTSSAKNVNLTKSSKVGHHKTSLEWAIASVLLENDRKKKFESPVFGRF